MDLQNNNEKPNELSPNPEQAAPSELDQTSDQDIPQTTNTTTEQIASSEPVVPTEPTTPSAGLYQIQDSAQDPTPSSDIDGISPQNTENVTAEQQVNASPYQAQPYQMNPDLNQNPNYYQGASTYQDSYGQSMQMPEQYSQVYQNPPSPTGALVCGILAIVFCFMPLVGIILGIVAIVLAGKYYNNGGTAGTGKAGRICGIVGIVLSALTFFISVVLIIVGLTVLDDYDTNYSTYSNSRGATYQQYDSDDEEAKEAISLVMEERLNSIKDKDPQAMAAITELVRSNLQMLDDNDDVAYIDTIDFAQYVNIMMTPFDYDLSYIDIYSDGSAEATYWITMKDSYSFQNKFSALLDQYEETTDFGSLTIEQLDADYNTMMMQAATEADTTRSAIIMVQLEQDVKGNWVIDEESWNDEIAYLLI